MSHACFRQKLSFIICLFCFSTLNAQELGKPLTLEAALDRL